MAAAQTARARARAELTAEILDAAHRQLSSVGPAGLSLRAIARELGMSSSAIYRYFASRDALLTELIVDAYDALGADVEAAEAAVDRTDIAGRFMTAARATRRWALENPHRYALVYGSPVPGYVAPDDTINPAARVGLIMVHIVRDAAEAGQLRAIDPTPDDGRGHLVEGSVLEEFGTAAHPVVEGLDGMDEAYATTGILMWTAMFGTISFELFGHLVNVVVDREAYFDETMRRLGRLCGLDI